MSLIDGPAWDELMSAWVSKTEQIRDALHALEAKSDARYTEILKLRSRNQDLQDQLDSGTEKMKHAAEELSVTKRALHSAVQRKLELERQLQFTIENLPPPIIIPSDKFEAFSVKRLEDQLAVEKEKVLQYSADHLKDLELLNTLQRKLDASQQEERLLRALQSNLKSSYDGELVRFEEEKKDLTRLLGEERARNMDQRTQIKALEQQLNHADADRQNLRAKFLANSKQCHCLPEPKLLTLLRANPHAIVHSPSLNRAFRRGGQDSDFIHRVALTGEVESYTPPLELNLFDVKDWCIAPPLPKPRWIHLMLHPISKRLDLYRSGHDIRNTIWPDGVFLNAGSAEHEARYMRDMVVSGTNTWVYRWTSNVKADESAF